MRRSFETSAAAWVFFYMYSIFMCILVVLAGALALSGHLIATACGSIGVVLLAFIYARLIGRVIWFASQRDAGLLPGTAPKL
jgi:hypothetical protein